MRIAIIGAGLTGLSVAHVLSEDPRHATTVFETRARFGARRSTSSVSASRCATPRRSSGSPSTTPAPICGSTGFPSASIWRS